MARERFFGRTVLGLRTAERPQGVGAPTLPPPTRKAPLPPTQETPLTDTAIDGIIRTGKTEAPPKKPNNTRKLISRGFLAGLVLTGIGVEVNKVLSNDEPTPQTNSQTRSIDSFPNSFNPKEEGPVLVETKKVNPSLEEHKDIVLPVIDPKHPERINLVSPITLGPGSKDRKLEIAFGQDNMGGGIRTIKRIDPVTKKGAEERIVVNSLFKIQDGVKEGDPLKSPVRCDPPLHCSIASGSTKMDENGIVNPGGFKIKIEDEKGNFAIVMMRTAPVKLTKDLPPMQSKRIGNHESSGIETYVPLENDEEIGRMVGSSKDPFTNAQILILAFSTVVGEDGTKQSGPADIVVDSSSNSK